MNFKSKHEHTISFSAEGFEKLMSKSWDILYCRMSSGRTIELTRNEVLQHWCRTREWRRVPHSNMRIKVIHIG